MVDCAQFLNLYSDYRDGLLEHEQEADVRRHLRSCLSCARYDEVVGGGVEIFRDLPQLTPSSDFQARLQHRIFHLEDDRAHRSHASGASMAVMLGICTAIGASAWLPTLRPPSEPVRLPPVVAHAPYHHPTTPMLLRSGPLLTPPEPEFPAGRYGEPPRFHTGSLLSPVATRPVSALYYPEP